jgi:branched-chain amino acid transport system ATP-binding protein
VTAAPSGPLLAVSDVCVRYGQVAALDGLSLAVAPGEIVALLGPNGVGKTTTLRAITGVATARSGRIEFDGRPIQRLSPDRIVRRGMASVPEGRRIFPDHTVAENLQLGGYIWRRDGSVLAETLEHVLDLFPRLRERAGQKAGTLSGGEAQMLAVGRALMIRPRLLVLDEPSLGLAPRIVSELFEHLARLHAEQHLSILLVEQAATRALELADRAYLLNAGRVVTSGTAAEMREDPDVQRVYFGA